MLTFFVLKSNKSTHKKGANEICDIKKKGRVLVERVTSEDPEQTSGNNEVFAAKEGRKTDQYDFLL